jgi:rhamnogalacturonyl hydrolase YesR
VTARLVLDDARAEDDGFPAGALQSTWRAATAPEGGVAVFEPSSGAVNPTVTLTGPPGAWRLEIMASDGGLESRDDVVVTVVANPLPPKETVVRAMRRANDYWLHGHLDPGPAGWERAVYFEGDMAMAAAYPDPKYLRYAVAWGDRNRWALPGGVTTRKADDQCCGQTYLDLYLLDPRPERIAMLEQNLEGMLATAEVSDWTWVDALQMAMPTFAKMGALRGDARYFTRLFEMYDWAKRKRGGGLYSATDHLWWRDLTFKPPRTEPNGEGIFWSRGNGWAAAAHVRTLAALPADDPHRAEYIETLREMAEALAALQRSDGFWNSSLHDPTHEDGPDTSGTAFFTYALAWGIRNGVLDSGTYLPVVGRAYEALRSGALHPDGRLGYIQPVGAAPRRPTYEDHYDFGVGAFLLASSEVLALAPGTMPRLVSDANVAKGGPVTASAQESGSDAARAVDGDDFTRWSALGYPQWIEVDLGKVRAVRGVELAPVDGRAYGFRVEVRTAGDAVWETVVDDTANTEGGPLLERSFAPRPSRFVRLTVTGSADPSTGWVSILEFRVLE